MDIDVTQILEIYKEEVANLKHENIVLKAVQRQLIQELNELKKQLESKEG